MATTFCWLVELFHRGGNSLGRYHTGFTDLRDASRSTADISDARRYASKKNAQRTADKLNTMMMACEWRAVEHGFMAEPTPCAHIWKVAHEGVQYMDCRCDKCGATKRETWD